MSEDGPARRTRGATCKPDSEIKDKEKVSDKTVNVTSTPKGNRTPRKTKDPKTPKNVVNSPKANISARTSAKKKLLLSAADISGDIRQYLGGQSTLVTPLFDCESRSGHCREY